MYKIEYYKDNNEGWRKVESRIVRDDKLRVNLYNLQKRGYFIQMVNYMVYIHTILKDDKESDNQRVKNIMYSYPEGFTFRIESDAEYLHIEVYPPDGGIMQYIPNNQL